MGTIVESKAFELGEMLKNKKIVEKIPIVIFGSPDPDAIGSAYALQVILEHFGIDSIILAEKEISHPNNQTLVNLIDLTLTPLSSYTDDGTYYAIVDHQHRDLNDRKCLIHIDHHSDSEEADVCFKDIKPSASSCSTLLVDYLKELDLLPSCPVSQGLSLALAYGIYSDTNSLFGANSHDIEALSYLRKYYDQEGFLSVAKAKYSRQTVEVIKKVLIANKTNGTFSYSGIGRISSEYRDSLTTAADFLMGQEGISNVLVYAIIESGNESYINGCFRTITNSFDTDKFMKSFVINGTGGGKKTAGGFNEPLGFISSCKDLDKVWDIVSSVIEDKIESKVNLTKT